MNDRKKETHCSLEYIHSLLQNLQKLSLESQHFLLSHLIGLAIAQAAFELNSDTPSETDHPPRKDNPQLRSIRKSSNEISATTTA